MRVLVVEDERRMAELLSHGLSEEGHSVTCALDGSEGLRMVREQAFDVVILDVMLPKLDGFELAHRMRGEKNSTAVLMLTAKDAVPDIVHGLEAGADDYMTKPFSFQELLLRLRAVKRRTLNPPVAQLRVADLVLDRSTRQVFRNGVSISLTRTEYSLLDRLMSEAGQVVEREALIAAVWGSGEAVQGNTLDAFIRLLRNKIDVDEKQKLLRTVRGCGYSIGAEWPW